MGLGFAKIRGHHFGVPRRIIVFLGPYWNPPSEGFLAFNWVSGYCSKNESPA